MKKLFLIINIVFMALIACGTVCYFVFPLEKIKVLTTASVLVVGALNLFNVFYQNSNNKKFGISLFSSIAFTCVGIFLISLKKDNTTEMNFSLVGIFLTIGLAGYILSLVFKNGFKYTDCFYAGAIFVPFAILIIVSPLFGFANAFEIILNLIFMLAISCFVGKAFADLIKKQDVTNILMFIASLFISASYLLLILNAFAYIPVELLYVMISCLYVTLILMGYVLFHMTKFKSSTLKRETEKTIEKNKDEKLENSKFNLKRDIIYSISLCLVIILTGFSVVTSFIKKNNINNVNNNVSTAKISKDQFLEMVGEDLNIPLVEINTENSKLPQDKENYVNSSFSITNCDDNKDNFSVEMGVNDEGDYNAGIRLRGNSTFREEKKPYRIKFAEKKSFFGLEENKSWVLLADYFDQSSIRNYSAFALAQSVILTLPEEEQYFAPTGHHVALIINDEFKGLYLLCEQMDENKGRAAVKDKNAFNDVENSTEFPFFVEMDHLAYNEGVTGVDNFYIDSVSGFSPVEIKYPEADERGATETIDKAFDYIKEYMNAVCKLIKEGGTTTVSFRKNPVSIEQLVDIDSFVDYYLLTEITHNSDSIYKSIYFSKKTDGLLKIGPIWDFDWSMADECVVPYQKSYIETANNLFVAKNSAIFNNLFKLESFYTKVATRFDAIKGKILETADYLKTYKAKIDAVAIIDAEMWYGETGIFQYDMQYDYVRLYLYDRYTYLDTVFDMDYSAFMTEINI